MSVPRVSTVLLEASALITMLLLSKVNLPLLSVPRCLHTNTRSNDFIKLTLSRGDCMFSDNPGALVGDRVRCPFHGACFNVRTGDIEEYPGLDSLPSYKVKHVCKHQHLIAT